MHFYSGPNGKFWEKELSTKDTEVLCIDILSTCKADVMDDKIYKYLLMLASTGKVREVLGGPPCRTVSALRFQCDGGPGIIRTEADPYGAPGISPEEQALVTKDALLFLRMLFVYAICEDVRPPEAPTTGLTLEQPEDPARYRNHQEVAAKGFMSVWRTPEWQQFQQRFDVVMVHFDQGQTGHKKRKPTTLALVGQELTQLDGLRCEVSFDMGGDDGRKSMTMAEKCAESRTWAEWSQGLKAAIVVALRQRLQDQHLRQLLSDPPSQVRQEPDSVQPEQQVPKLKPLGAAALQKWKDHYLNDHMPARRDCQHCVRSQARGKPHRRILHPEAYTLAVDLSGKLSSGINQERRHCSYMMVAVYTFPVTQQGRSLLADDQQDHPLPDPDAFPGEDEVIDDDQQEDPLQESEDEEICGEGEDGGHLAEAATNGCLDAWNKLVEESKNVAVKNVTMVEVVESRNAHHILPAIARIYSRLRQLGLPVMRLHSDRAREFTSLPVRRWAQARDIVITKTSGDNYKANGRCECALGQIKRATRTVLSAGGHNVNWWPLAAKHVGERKLRSQLRALGYPVGDLLQFGSQAYALRKWWHHRYEQWRDIREPVVVLGPDACSTLSTTNYFVQAVESGRYFFTDDVIVPNFEANADVLQDQQQDDPHAAAEAAPLPDPHGAPDIYLPERDEQSRPSGAGMAPSRRLRQKTAPAMLHRLSMETIEGERQGNAEMDGNSFANRFENLGRVSISSSERDSDESSWTLETLQSSVYSTSGSSEEEDLSGGDVEGAPKSWCGGSSPAASNSKEGFLRKMHGNLSELVNEEMSMVDATTADQAWWLPVLSEVLVKKVAVEEELHQLEQHKEEAATKAIENQFLVTKTVSNKEVWESLADWEPSIRAEYDQLVHQKKAVIQMSQQQLRERAAKAGVEIELLPVKMVHTRKAQSGAYRSRAVICGNYATATEQDVYAGGTDGTQVRTALKTAAMFNWRVMGTDIRTAFLNAKRRDETKLVAMSIPTVFKKLNLAKDSDVWLVEMALYGLTTSPKDWGICRDTTLPQLSRKRINKDGIEVTGRFLRTQDDNLWRLMETGPDLEQRWCGLLCVYVDDLLFCGEEEVLCQALKAVEATWSCAAAEWATETTPLKFCGMEITMDSAGNGLHLAQKGYEKELLERWKVTGKSDFPMFKLSESDFEAVEVADVAVLKEAQALAGGLLWLSTKTRPDLAYGVATMSRLMTRNAQKALEVGQALLKYISSNPGDLHYFRDLPNDGWGERGQLKIQRNHRSIEIFSDISYAAGTSHRSIQGVAVFFGGSPIAWQSSQQAFATHSTAESELVAYCESLLIGRATEALLCAMWGEPLDNNPFTCVIYGDNMAAIGLAHGNTCSSWRTRHLRIRASILKEAMEESCSVPGGVWRLVHLKGSELVADGLTKQLLGQSFDRFCEDLGLCKQLADKPVEKEKAVTTSTTMATGVAVKVLTVGSVLMQHAKAMSNATAVGDEDLTALWTTGIILMVMGAIYVMQLMAKGVHCCMRRLWASGSQVRSEALASTSTTVGYETSEEEMSAGSSEISAQHLRRRVFGEEAGDSETQRMRTQSGSHGATSSMDVSATMTLQSMPRSGSAASMTLQSTPQSGSAASLTLRSVPHSGFQASTSNQSTSQSGSQEQSTSTLGMTRRSGVALAAESSRAAIGDEMSEPRSVGRVVSTAASSYNPWNEFQRANRDKGWGSEKMRAEYYKMKSRRNT